MRCWARYFKKVISYFSQIVTELHHYTKNELPGKVTIVTFKKKIQMCQITWMPQY